MVMLGSRHPIAAMSELVRDLSPEAQSLAIGAIQRVLNQARFYDENRASARNLAARIAQVEHNHEPFRGTADPCERCKLEAREQSLLATVDGLRLLMTNGGRLS